LAVERQLPPEPVIRGPCSSPTAVPRNQPVLVFSPNGKTIVSRSGEFQFREAASGKHLGPDTSSDLKPVTNVAFGRDGQTLVSFGSGGLRTWDLAAIIGRGNSGLRTELWDAPAVWIDRLCSKLVRNLSRAERRCMWALRPA